MTAKKNVITYKEEEKVQTCVTYGSGECRFGKCVMALKDDRICFLSFLDGPCINLMDIQKIFPKALLIKDDDLISCKVQQLFNTNNRKNFEVLLKGTDFEKKVWECLLEIKEGSTTTYEQVAKAIGNPKAIRAVANAIAKNRIAYLVPCHRVISKNGAVNKYRWGSHRKLHILREEKAL